MTSKKPRTALAKLLDSMKEINSLEEGSTVATPSLQPPQTTPVINQHKLEPVAPPQTEVHISTQELSEEKLAWLDPSSCQPWQFADRPEDEMGDIDKLANSLKTVGQQEPVLVRPKNDLSGRYEIIFGNRRARAAKIAKIKLLAIIKNVNDQDAALYQTEENEERKDLSDLARAKSYKAQLDAGIFESEAELGKKLMISRKTLNDIMAFIRVPEELAIAIPNYKYLSRAMVLRLASLAKDKAVMRKLIALAPKIGQKSITTTNLGNYLSAKRTANLQAPQQEIVKNTQGTTLFTLSKNTKGQTILKIPANLQGADKTEELKQILYNYLSKTND